MPAKAINLLPQKELDTTVFGRFLRWALTYGRYIIICTEIIVLLAFIYRFSLDRTITDLNEEIDQKAAIVQANQGFEKSFRNLQNRTLYISQLFNNQDQIIATLTNLETITPTQVKLISLTFNQSGIALTGFANSSSSLTLFIQNLKSSTQLSNIVVPTVSRTGGKDTGQIRFSIEAQFKAAQ